jgi:hypothetical protein
MTKKKLGCRTLINRLSLKVLFADCADKKKRNERISAANIN